MAKEDVPEEREVEVAEEEEEVYEDEEVAVCTECKTQQTERYVLGNPFYGQGKVPCQYCTAPIVYTRRSQLASTLASIDRNRGLA